MRRLQRMSVQCAGIRVACSAFTHTRARSRIQVQKVLFLQKLEMLAIFCFFRLYHPLCIAVVILWPLGAFVAVLLHFGAVCKFTLTYLWAQRLQKNIAEISHECKKHKQVILLCGKITTNQNKIDIRQ